jgi:hypothetical protein
MFLLPCGKPLDELNIGEGDLFRREGRSETIMICRGHDNDSISYGPFLNGKEYRLIALHLKQSADYLRLAAHYASGDPVIVNVMNMLENQVRNAIAQMVSLEKLADAPPTPLRSSSSSSSSGLMSGLMS